MKMPSLVYLSVTQMIWECEHELDPPRNSFCPDKNGTQDSANLFSFELMSSNYSQH